MKSLDEVIKTLEEFWICPSSDEANEYCELWSVKDDALCYLKEYQKVLNKTRRERLYDALREVRGEK